jgi:hypothetical protein
MGEEVTLRLWKDLLHLIESSELSAPFEDESRNLWSVWYTKLQYRDQKNPLLDCILIQLK